MAAQTAVESVRWRPRALRKPLALKRSSMVSNSVRSALLGLEAFQHGVQQRPLGAARDQAAAQRTEHRGLKAGIGQLQAESGKGERIAAAAPPSPQNHTCALQRMRLKQITKPL